MTQSGRDYRCEVARQQAARPDVALDFGAEHPQAQHVEQQMRDVIGTMQERISNDLPEVKIRLTIDGLQRPQCEELIQRTLRHALQDEHQRIRGDQ